jgi:hypothetical protein
MPQNQVPQLVVTTEEVNREGNTALSYLQKHDDWNTIKTAL